MIYETILNEENNKKSKKPIQKIFQLHKNSKLFLRSRWYSPVFLPNERQRYCVERKKSIKIAHQGQERETEGNKKVFAFRIFNIRMSNQIKVACDGCIE